jgi:hypothetical protein
MRVHQFSHFSPSCFGFRHGFIMILTDFSHGDLMATEQTRWLLSASPSRQESP